MTTPAAFYHVADYPVVPTWVWLALLAGALVLAAVIWFLAWRLTRPRKGPPPLPRP